MRPSKGFEIQCPSESKIFVDECVDVGIPWLPVALGME